MRPLIVSSIILLFGSNLYSYVDNIVLPFVFVYFIFL